MRDTSVKIFSFWSAIYIFLLVICLTSCSSCSKKPAPKEVTTEDYSYEDFQDVNDGGEEIEPSLEKEYHIKFRVIRRVYLV